MREQYKKYDEQLGMRDAAASQLLRRMLLLSYAKQLGLNICYRCGEEITDPNGFHMDHKVDWRNSDNHPIQVQTIPPRDSTYPTSNGYPFNLQAVQRTLSQLNHQLSSLQATPNRNCIQKSRQLQENQTNGTITSARAKGFFLKHLRIVKFLNEVCTPPGDP